MRRNTKSITTSPDIVRHIDGLIEANFKLLTQLIEWLAGQEKQHTKFRMAVIHRLARMEAALSLILVGQQAQTQTKLHVYDADKLKEDARWAEEFISKQSGQMGLKMIRYIYGEDRTPEPRHDRRWRWWGWEIWRG